MKELATTVEKAERKGNIKQLYDTTKNLTWKYSKPERLVKDRGTDGPALLNPPSIEEAPKDLPIDVTPPTIKNIKMVIR
ncbi:unnamed protein product [Schistosoma curassoni]|uniref:Uncharacterized protein n=1 Tax=Schistosoma curassoni TaxID=6186 RepID=A0A183JRE3_9TREM|nr:unnamed protein product [Schistosoma curassoni]